MTNLRDEKQRWEKEILQPTTQRFPERKEVFKTSSDETIENVYLPQDAADDYMEKLSFPARPKTSSRIIFSAICLCKRKVEAVNSGVTKG